MKSQSLPLSPLKEFFSDFLFMLDAFTHTVARAKLCFLHYSHGKSRIPALEIYDQNNLSVAFDSLHACKAFEGLKPEEFPLRTV